MVKVKAVKFGSSVNAANKEHTFVLETNEYVTPYFDIDREVIVLEDKKTQELTIVFPTNVQWARIHKDVDEGNKVAGASRGHGTRKTP